MLPALALIETSDIPTGYLALDALVKEAEVEILAVGTVQGGSFLVAFAGEVEPVERSFASAMGRAGHASGALIDAVLLPFAEPRIVPALREGRAHFPLEGDALAVFQTSSSPTLVRAVDAALKGAEVGLVELRLAEGLAGRGLATLWGRQSDVEAAVDYARAAFARGRLEGASAMMIANADPAVARAIGGGTRFFKEHRG